VSLLAAQAEVDRAGVVTKAVLRAAEALGLSARRLAQAIGASEPTISRMRKGNYVLEANGKPFELSVLLIRVFRSLDAIAGGDAAVIRGWMSSENTALGARPIDRIGTIAGLMDVLAYLDARRAPL
jgi:hypothetical protein